MHLSTRVRRPAAAAFALVACATGGVLAATPASANDVTLKMTRGGEVVARAHWDDLHDTLCVKVLKGKAAEAGIAPVDRGTGPEFVK